jgi:Tripartite tricarboxylate transporter TctB family
MLRLSKHSEPFFNNRLEHTEDSVSRKKIEFLFSAVIVLFLFWVLWEPQSWPAPARLFPWSLGFSVLALALIQFVAAACAVVREISTGSTAQDELARDTVDFRDHHRAGDKGVTPAVAMNPPPSGHATPVREPAGQRVITICLWIVGFFLGIWLVGFKFGAFFLTIAFMKFAAKEKWPISATMALGTYLFFWLVFDIGLKLPLGDGLIADYFFLD